MHDCVICYEEFTKQCKVVKCSCCDNKYHYSCIETWFKTSKQTFQRCPYCNQRWSPERNVIDYGILLAFFILHVKLYYIAHLYVIPMITSMAIMLLRNVLRWSLTTVVYFICIRYINLVLLERGLGQGSPIAILQLLDRHVIPRVWVTWIKKLFQMSFRGEQQHNGGDEVVAEEAINGDEQRQHRQQEQQQHFNILIRFGIGNQVI